MAKIIIKFQDDVEKTYFLDEDENLVEGLEQRGLSLLTDCRNGECSTCLCSLKSGTVHMYGYDRNTLTEEEKQEGSILACSSYVTGDVTVEVPYDSVDADDSPYKIVDVRLKSIDYIGQDIVHFVVIAVENQKFRIGQYYRFSTLEEPLERAFSVASAPNSNLLEFYINKLPNSRFIAWLSKHKVGDILKMRGPIGRFDLTPRSSRQIFIAGGTGLAPFLSAVRSGAYKFNDTEIVLLIGARSEERIFCKDELGEYAKNNSRFNFSYTIRTEPRENNPKGGVISLIDNLEIYTTDYIYVCGPPAMVKTVVGYLAEKKSASQILYEKFI